MSALDPTDRSLIKATQAGLPLTARPYAQIATWLMLTEDEVIARLTALQDRGIIRRIAIAPNHYALGMVANGMSVWDVDDAQAATLGAQIGALDFVTHCYLRPRAPVWRYNLFAMLHGASRAEVEGKRAQVRAILGAACRADDILYSTRILKKTGLRSTRSPRPCHRPERSGYAAGSRRCSDRAARRSHSAGQPIGRDWTGVHPPVIAPDRPGAGITPM